MKELKIPKKNHETSATIVSSKANELCVQLNRFAAALGLDVAGGVVEGDLQPGLLLVRRPQRGNGLGLHVRWGKEGDETTWCKEMMCDGNLRCKWMSKCRVQGG